MVPVKGSPSLKLGPRGGLSRQGWCHVPPVPRPLGLTSDPPRIPRSPRSTTTTATFDILSGQDTVRHILDTEDLLQGLNPKVWVRSPWALGAPDLLRRAVRVGQETSEGETERGGRGEGEETEPRVVEVGGLSTPLQPEVPYEGRTGGPVRHRKRTTSPNHKDLGIWSQIQYRVSRH